MTRERTLRLPDTCQTIRAAEWLLRSGYKPTSSSDRTLHVRAPAVVVRDAREHAADRDGEIPKALAICN